VTYGEAALIMRAIDQVCLLHPVDKAWVAIAGLSKGASMAALLVTRHTRRFKAGVMHSGIPPGTAHFTLSALGAMHGHRSTMPLAATPSTMEANWPPLLVIQSAGKRGHACTGRRLECCAGRPAHCGCDIHRRNRRRLWRWQSGQRSGTGRDRQAGQFTAGAECQGQSGNQGDGRGRPYQRPERCKVVFQENRHGLSRMPESHHDAP
jgi:hypothetical protein